jgi:WD40 repeat protein
MKTDEVSTGLVSAFLAAVAICIMQGHRCIAQEPSVQTTLKGHTGTVYSVAFTMDGKTLASGGGERTVILWDVATGTQRVMLSGHTGHVRSVAFTKDGKTLASAGGSDDFARPDGTVRLWDVAAGRELAVLKHDHEVFCVAFSPDGKILAAASSSGVILWDLPKRKRLATLKVDGASVFSVAFTADGKTLVSGGGSMMHDGQLKLWNVVEATAQTTLAHKIGSVSAVALSPDGNTLATGSAEIDDKFRALPGEVKLWDLTTRKERAALKGHANWVQAVAIAPDGKTLATGSMDETIRLWDLVSGKELHKIKGDDGFWSVAFSPDGNTLASGGHIGKITLWNVYPGKKENK